MNTDEFFVIPAQAGIQEFIKAFLVFWLPLKPAPA